MDVAVKPLEADPFLLSQPMGAALAFSGVKNCMPLLHGVQGCAGFAKELFSCHFNKSVIPTVFKIWHIPIECEFIFIRCTGIGTKSFAITTFVTHTIDM